MKLYSSSFSLSKGFFLILSIIIGAGIFHTASAYYYADFSYSAPLVTPTSHFSPLEEVLSEKKCTLNTNIPVEIEIAFQEAIKDIPCELLQSLQRIDIFEDLEGNYPRAMANSRIIKIREDAIYEPEFVNVLIHELGHVVDLGALETTTYSEISVYTDGAKQFYTDDISIDFYALSWKKEGVQNDYITKQDFVSGYASYDMFEDFSESFLLYMQNGYAFRSMAQDNAILQKKYMFFKTHIFNGKEFATGDKNYISSKRVWDVTYLY